ncbi:kinase-like protein, partial [Hypoxylon sp. EC38]
MYNLGGHHPVHLDDILDGRFEVVHKLGNGGFGIVWLCRDITLGKWRAVKIMTADYSSRGVEERIFDHLRSQFTTTDLDKHHITVPLEQFWLEGPNGRHLCLVMPILGMDISNWRLTLRNVHEQMVTDTKRICRQAIEALRFLHEQGICHGDFKPGNILMKIKGIDDLSKEQLIEIMGEPELIEVETVSGVPTLYAAPEVMFRTTAPGTYSDIWSLACLIYEICAGDPLF